MYKEGGREGGVYQNKSQNLSTWFMEAYLYTFEHLK